MALFDFRLPRPSSKFSPPTLVEYNQLPASTKRLAAAFQRLLPGSQVFGRGASIALRHPDLPDINVPIIGGSALGISSGIPKGWRGSINYLNPGFGGARSAVYSPMKMLAEAIATGNPARIRSVSSTITKALRYADVDEASKNVYTPMHLLHSWQYRVSPKAGIPVGGNVYYPGDRSLYNLADPKATMMAMSTAVLERSAGMGLRLYRDPTKEQALYHQLYSKFAIGDIHPFGNIYPGGTKIAQQFKGVPIGAVPINTYGLSRSNQLGGRTIRTRFEYDLATVNPLTGAYGKSPVLQGLNVPTRLYFGAGAEKLFTSKESLMLTPDIAQAMGMHIGSPAFIGNIKTNVSRVSRGLGKGVGAATIADLKKPAELFESLLGAYELMLARNAAGWERKDLVHTLRGAFESQFGKVNFDTSVADTLLVSNFRRGKLVGDGSFSGRRLFQRAGKPLSAASSYKKMMGVLEYMKDALGKLGIHDNIFKVDASGNKYIDSKLFLQKREMDIGTYRSALGMGLNLYSGRRIAPNTAATAYLSGAPALASFYERQLSNPQLVEMAGFQRVVAGIQGSLIKGANLPAYSPTGVAAYDAVHFANRRDQIRAVANEFKEFKKVSKGLVGSAAMMDKLAELVPEMQRGFVFNLGESLGINTNLKYSKTNLTLQGSLTSLPISNPHADPNYAYSIAKILSGDYTHHDVESVIKANFRMWAGGKRSIINRYLQPKVGSSFWSVMQTMHHEEIRALAKHALGPKYSSRAEYAFISQDMWDKLVKSKAYGKRISKLGYAPVLAGRYPMTGSSEMALRLIPASWKMGKKTMIVGPGIPGKGIGDTDFDTLESMLAIGDKDLKKGFHQLERAQYSDLKLRHKAAIESIRQDALAAEGYVTGFASGRPHEDTLAYLDPEKRLEAEYAQAKVKSLTSFTDPEVKRREIALYQALKSGEIPEGLAAYSDKERAMVARVLGTEVYPGILQDVISKRAGGSTRSMLGEINQLVKNKGFDRAPVREKMYAILSQSYASMSKWPMMQLAKNSKQLLGMELYRGGKFKQMPAYDPSNVRLNKFLDAAIDVESLSGNLKALELGSPMKDAYSPEAAIRQVRGAVTDNVYATETEAGFARAMGKDIDSQVMLNIAKKRSADAGKTVASDVSDGLLRGAGRQFSEFAKDNPLLTLSAIAIGAAGITSYGINKIRDMTHIGEQQAPGSVSPRTVYTMDDLDNEGFKLNLGARVPPESISLLSGLANRVNAPSDVRIRDSSRRVSDRFIGYDANRKMRSVYNRDSING